MSFFALSAVTGPRSLRACWNLPRGALRVGLMTLALLGGCSLNPGPRLPSAKPPAPAQPSPAPQAAVKPVARVAILYAKDVAVYRQLATRLAKDIGARSEVFPLTFSPEGQPAILDSDLSEYGDIVAIGAAAARHASRLPDKRLVFCQVFNYDDYGLAKPNTLGVSMLAPPARQFEAWHRLDPGVKKIAVLTGPGHAGLIAQARAAAARADLQLVHRVALTDKDMLYEFKRMVPEIDGVWLLPDERILSHRVLRELMRYSARHKKQVAVFAPQLLQLGALLSASSTEADIADQVVAALRHLDQDPPPLAFRLLPLTQADIKINSTLAQGLGLRTLAKQKRSP